MRINYINSLRLLATLSVVWLHTSAGLLDARAIMNSDAKFWLSCHKYCMQFGVPVFVMISGALFFESRQRNWLWTNVQEVCETHCFSVAAIWFTNVFCGNIF